jgi:hypothetical protein
MMQSAEARTPLVSVSAGLPDFLARVRVLVEHAIHRRWSEGLLNRDPDGVFTSFLGAEHIERLAHPSPSAPVMLAETRFAGGPFAQFVVEQRLSPSEADLFALLLACEIDPATSRLTTYLGGNQAQFMLSLELVFEIVYRNRTAHAGAVAQLHQDLAPHGRLRRLGLIAVDDGGKQTLLNQTIRLPARVVRWLLGERVLDASVAAELTLPATPVGRVTSDALRTALAAFSAGGRALVLEGAQHTGRAMLLRFAAAKLQRPLLLVGGRAPINAELIAAGFREAALHGALLAFGGASFDADATARLRDCLSCWPETVAFLAGPDETHALGSLRPLAQVRVSAPPIEERLDLWREFLGAGTALSSDDLRETAALYNIGVAGIVEACATARDLAGGRALERADVSAAIRRLYHDDLAAIANRVDVRQTWEDLVLPDDVGDSIVAVVDRVRYRGDVLGRWGFARKLGKGLGTTVLFSGEPGTGKSMVAGLIAKELGLELYVINLARLVSKWIGETEKNLARAFDAAEAGHVLLLFDEADSILAKRTADVRSSNDRYANLETNFVLARLEQFQGVAVFTTNLASAVDPAMERRMSVHVNFPFPDGRARAELWRRMIPAEARAATDIDFEWLAERYQLSGGFIRNIILRAAFIAARLHQSLGMEHLVEAVELEYHERGALFAGGKLS